MGWLIGFIIWLLIAFFLYRNRIWVFYYIWGAVGFTLLAILVVRSSPVEYAIEAANGWILHYLLAVINIPTYLFDNAPGTVLVMMKLENAWTCINIDIECSGILEGCVLLGLVLFYPLLSVKEKVAYTVGGLSGLMVINLIRLLVIVVCINTFGRDAMYIAHTLLGRLVFFLLVIVLYWYLFTRVTLSRLRKRYDDE
ncbi:MAG: exosortase family protein XrtG [Methanomassiliicoccales archaeon]